MASTKRGQFRFQVRDWAVWYVDLDAPSEPAAMEKVMAFFKHVRPVSTEYSHDGVHAILDEKSMGFVKKSGAKSDRTDGPSAASGV
jgi:hypothetical protein